MSFIKILKTSWKVASVFSILTGRIYADDGLCNPSARPITQPKTIDMVLETIYWYTSENMDWAYTLFTSNRFVQTDYKVFVFNWAPGFRIGLGYNMEHDQWDTQASYTWFQSEASGSTGGPVIPGFLPARLSGLEPFSKGNASINLHYNMFDWDLGRAFFVSNHLLLRPFIGMKAGWITQKLHSNWELFNFFGSDSLFATENLMQSFAGGGPKGGFSSKWLLCCSEQYFFSLVGMCEAGYLWGHWSIHDEYEDSLATTIPLITTPRRFGSFVLHSFIGLGWDADFDHDRSHFEFKLGYEIEDWFNHCQFFTDINGAQNNDLILTGFSASLRFDF